MKSERMKDRWVNLCLILIFVVGLGILLYPSVSDWWNKRVSTQAIASYNKSLENMTEEDYSSFFEEAETYNKAVRKVGSQTAIVTPESVAADYWETLDITGTGIMGYVTVDKINVQLPVYHGTEESVLQIAAGHLQGTSLPIGGEGTHAVLSAHRGLPSAKMFTNLDDLEEGDTFTVTVLDEILTYEVDKISIILPEEIESLYIEDGEDYCTLMTCTPYGINTHRLLVRGRRIQTTNQHVNVSAEAYRLNNILIASLLAVLILVIFLVSLYLRKRFRARTKTKERRNGQEE